MLDGFALDSKLKWFSSVGFLFLGTDFPPLIIVFTGTFGAQIAVGLPARGYVSADLSCQII